MNIVLWILQVLLALHTVMGAVWKFSNPEQAVPSLRAIPHGVWMFLIAVEVVCALGLVLPGFVKSLRRYVPLAAVGIALEMLMFTAVHMASGFDRHGEVVYWLVVAALSGGLAVARFKYKPL